MSNSKKRKPTLTFERSTLVVSKFALVVPVMKTVRSIPAVDPILIIETHRARVSLRLARATYMDKIFVFPKDPDCVDEWAECEKEKCEQELAACVYEVLDSLEVLLSLGPLP